MTKPKVAFYWCASCGGCEEAVIDLAEDILKVVDAVDIVLWPVAMDFKKSDIKAMADGSIAVSFINGAIRTSEQDEWAKLLRKKSGLVVAFGACSHLGGIPGLANLSSRQNLFDTVYINTPTVNNPDNVFPQTSSIVAEGELELPEISEEVRALNQVIDVDYYLPGCAPPPNLIMDAVMAILSGNLPEKGTVLAPDKSLCDTCPRKESKPDKLKISSVKRISMTTIPDDKCFLAEGIVCLGPATRSGCGDRCINANMPCRGCFGPTKAVQDQGAKFLSGFSSLFDSDNETAINTFAESVIDPAGLFYMFSLASSLKTKFHDRS
ncbi:MAG: oxidoreductase [Candidatus Marinimicrobia bacterium]|nr:oxidoreductase [Candidatus Neomarinimicrobiota bacterium]